MDLPHLRADMEDVCCSEVIEACMDTSWESFHARDNATARFYKERRQGPFPLASFFLRGSAQGNISMAFMTIPLR